MNEDPRTDEVRQAMVEHLARVNAGMTDAPDVVFASTDDEERYALAVLTAMDGVADGSILEASLTVLASMILGTLGAVDAADPHALAEANDLLTNTEGLIVHSWVTSGALSTLVAALAGQHTNCNCPWSPGQITATVLDGVRFVMPIMIEQLRDNLGE